MSDSPSGKAPETVSADGAGILAGLPHTRPQRPSPRRAAARAATAATTASESQPRRPHKRTGERAGTNSRRPGKRPQPHTTPWMTDEPAPRQGFEAESDSLGPVQPPSGAEFLTSAVELAGELAKGGLTTGARALRDLLSRLPG